MGQKEKERKESRRKETVTFTFHMNEAVGLMTGCFFLSVKLQMGSVFHTCDHKKKNIHILDKPFCVC